MKLLDIGEVSAMTGTRPSTLRYYEEIGLISSASRHGLRRQFSSDVVLQLKLITMAKSAGFSLDEISGMFGSNGVPVELILALEKRFLETGSPQNLTLLFGGGPGDGATGGANHLAHEGMLSA